MRWLRANWPLTTYAAGILVVLAALFVWVVPSGADPAAQAVHFVAVFEGFRADPYLDAAGCVTVGYGHLLTCDEGADPADYGAVTRRQAEGFLRGRIVELQRQIRDDLQSVDLTADQLVALTSICYNIGSGACRDSNLFGMIRDREPSGEIAHELLSWDHVGHQVNRGLSRRRLMELGRYFFSTSDLR